jgi:tetratricopeptide (TPR) repeat protein
MKSAHVFKLAACILIVAANLTEPARCQDSSATRQGIALNNKLPKLKPKPKPNEVTKPAGQVAANLRRARECALKGEYASAEKYLREIIALDAENFKAHNNLGNVHFLQGKLDSAEANYAKALPLMKTADDSLGMRFNLWTLWQAAIDDSLNLLAEKLADRLRDGNELDRFEKLLAQEFDESNSAKAGNRARQSVSTFNMEKFTLTANDGNKKKKGQTPPREKTKEAGQKGAMMVQPSEIVLFWAE